ncbi:hypothetical protein N7523_004754 [Penicillium sp. IBT 18751x]|nr:hypothetical protein N7523_004754 [Penicillium sp. IBT 18751x]
MLLDFFFDFSEKKGPVSVTIELDLNRIDQLATQANAKLVAANTFDLILGFLGALTSDNALGFYRLRFSPTLRDRSGRDCRDSQVDVAFPDVRKTIKRSPAQIIFV